MAGMIEYVSFNLVQDLYLFSQYKARTGHTGTSAHRPYSYKTLTGHARHTQVKPRNGRTNKTRTGTNITSYNKH